MQVETFECQETAAEPIEAGEEAIALIDKLGLEGQRSLIAKPSEADRETRCPYREMTAEERFVYGVLCPTVADLSTYTRTPIPLRVLQVAAHATELGIFSKLVVWDAASPAEKDPVLVGLMPRSQTESWRGDREFILARWGEELETFVVLAKRAVKVKRDSLEQALASIRSKVAVAIAELPNLSDAEIVSRGAGANPYFNGAF